MTDYAGTSVLQMRILICLSKMSPESCTVTNLAKTLATEKYVVSRAMVALEKRGMLNRTDTRHPKLTPNGFIAAKKYADRMDIASNHLLYEGVDVATARTDAAYISMYCSDATFDVIRDMEERYRMKYALRDLQNFDGTVLCRNLREGSYPFPFIIYREDIKNGSNVSMANDGFWHPCKLTVKREMGVISLKALVVSHCSAASGEKMRGKIKSMQYFDGQKFCDAERNGDILLFPADVLRFVNIGSDTGRIFHGSVCLKMACSVGGEHMPESMVIFTIIF